MSYRRPRSLHFGPMSPALLSGQKTVIRAPWSARRALAFQPGELVPAYDKHPKQGGRQIALLRIHQRPYQENSAKIPESEWEASGFAYMEEIGATIGSRHPRAMWKAIRDAAMDLWVVRFQVVDIVPEARDGFLDTVPPEPAAVG